MTTRSVLEDATATNHARARRASAAATGTRTGTGTGTARDCARRVSASASRGVGEARAPYHLLRGFYPCRHNNASLFITKKNNINFQKR